MKREICGFTLPFFRPFGLLVFNTIKNLFEHCIFRFNILCIPIYVNNMSYSRDKAFLSLLTGQSYIMLLLKAIQLGVYVCLLLFQDFPSFLKSA